MKKTDIGVKNILADIAASLLLALFGTALALHRYLGIYANRFTALLFGLAGCLALLRALLLLLDMGGIARTSRILKRRTELSLEAFAWEAGLTKPEAEKLMSCYISRKYIRGYVDEEGETIVMQSSEWFDAKKYAAYLRAEKNKRRPQANAAE